MKARYEAFGGIIRIEDPPATIYVDQNYMKNIGFQESKLWLQESAYLSAPIDVHFALTNKCPLECDFCYKSSTKDSKNEMSILEAKAIIDLLTKMHVFSVAFGGGEPFANEHIFEIAAYAREKGIIPNVTTNGYFINEENIKQCKIFGHVHVSLDYADSYFDQLKSKGAFTSAIKAIKLFKKNGIHVGVNCLITRANFDHLEELVKFCKRRGIDDIAFLRFKPIGKGRKRYEELKLSNEQNIKLFPKIKKITRKYRMRVQVDCSLTPIVCYHKPKVKAMEFFGAEGCEGGNTFIEIRADSKIRSCSFSNYYGENALDLPSIWKNSKFFTKYRNVIDSIIEPCKSCKYLRICRGGCHIISEFVTGEFNNPDPECPFVIEYEKSK